MKDSGRVGTAWILSALTHAALLLLAVSGGPAAGGDGLRLTEVGLVELPGADRTPPAPPMPSAPDAEPAAAPESPAPRRPSAEPLRPPKETVPPAADDSAVQSPPSTTGGGGAGAGSAESADPGWGTGEGFILSRPVSFPKNVQNEGIEGTVRLAIYLAAAERPRARMIESSGDPRLDQYSLRVVTEAWRYAPPPSGVQLLVELIFRDDRVEVVFDRATPWNGEEP